MKKNILTFLFILSCFTAFHGQTFRIYYQMTYKIDSTKNESVNKKMLLDVKDEISKFYSYDLYHIDSLALRNVDVRTKATDFDFLITKNKKENKIDKYYIIGLDRYSLKEDWPKLNWKITEETKNIDNVNCQKATLHYKGRDWTAWFAKEIPFQEGPYVFNSLPGLIVDMRDSGDNYIFTMTELKKDNGEVNMDNDFIPVTQKQLNKLYLDYYNDPYKELKAGKAVMKVVDESGRLVTPNFKQLTEFKQKFIKNNNNPIELSDAVKYP
ncbi:GLPGLI family protein [Chryseobacterium sp.]|uniref:GLPGLI family protein n=1 Tax=Chryseobacterium sp. TaxID=1871047 RepID=UPI0025C01867|nr:GLPGLI family protein [Chryseobacterium sp.]MBV8328320.1 GLPGLI family protein [Chryseobacterium sp.]